MPRSTTPHRATDEEKLIELIEYLHDGYLMLENVRLRNKTLYEKLSTDGGFIDKVYQAHDQAILLEQLIEKGGLYEEENTFRFANPVETPNQSTIFSAATTSFER
jgi:hypothetical protein